MSDAHPASSVAALPPAAMHLLRLFMQRGALRFGDFTLKSGRRSPYFVNTGCLHQGSDLAVFGRAYAECIAQLVTPAPQVIFGPAYKGIPLALATAQAYEQAQGCPVGWTYDRKEAKDHGDGGSFVGAPLEAGTRVVVVDDVLTAGTALRETLGKLRPLGVDIACAVVAVDRQEAGVQRPSARQEIEQDFALPVHPLMTIEQAVTVLEQGALAEVPPLDPELAARIREHLAGAG